MDESRLPPSRPAGFVLERTFGSAGSGDGQFVLPSGIARDAQDFIYVVDTGADRVQKFTSTGEFVLAFGSTGSGPGQFLSPVGIAITTPGLVLVADQNNNRIQGFTTDGVFSGEITDVGTGPGQLNLPRGLAVDGGGRIFVLDSEPRVQVFDADGAFEFQFGSAGTEVSQFQDTGGVAVDGDGNIHVSDITNPRVQKFGTTGGFFAVFDDPPTGAYLFPEFLAVGPEDDVFVSDQLTNRIVILTSDGEFRDQIDTDTDASLQSPRGVTVTSDGILYVVEASPPRIKRFVFDPGVP